jgi:hypothetical protein
VFPVGIGLRGPRSQKRDPTARRGRLGHPSISPFDIACGHERSGDARRPYHQLRKKAGTSRPLFFPHPYVIRGVNVVDARAKAGRVRRLLRFSLADGKQRKSRKPAPLPAQFR